VRIADFDDTDPVQKRIRLLEARARLLADPRDVAGVGHTVGYDGPSQFSREYRRMFGVPPSRDAAATTTSATTSTGGTVRAYIRPS
jgi:transcriptional regulator GlxA family with amidase domain